MTIPISWTPVSGATAYDLYQTWIGPKWPFPAHTSWRLKARSRRARRGDVWSYVYRIDPPS